MGISVKNLRLLVKEMNLADNTFIVLEIRNLKAKKSSSGLKLAKYCCGLGFLHFKKAEEIQGNKMHGMLAWEGLLSPLAS